MPNGVVVHREQVPAGGTWSVRAGLGGATPAFVLVVCIPVTHTADDTPQSGSGLVIGGSAGGAGNTYCNGHTADDGLAESNTYTAESDLALLRAIDPTTQADILRIDIPTFVANGLDVNVSTFTIRPMVEFLFFYGDDWEFFSTVIQGPQSPAVVVPTGFTGSNNDNQIFFFLGSNNLSISEREAVNISYPNFGVAVRNGPAGPPAGQHTIAVINRDAQSVGYIRATGLQDGVMATTQANGALSTKVACTDIGDSHVSVERILGTTRNGLLILGINLKDKQAWCGFIDSLAANGSWIVNDPGFEPDVVSVRPSQILTADGTRYDDDCEIGGMMSADANNEVSVLYSYEQGIATMVAKAWADDQFLNVPQDDGTVGWKSGPNDFSFTPTGFRVDNVVVDGGGGGAPLTIRKWLGWAIEGEAGPPAPEVLDIQDLRHSRPVDQVDVVELITIVPIDIDSLRHGRRVDSVTLGVSVDLFLASLRHGRPVDALILDVSVQLAPDALRHGRRVDIVDVQPLIGVVLDVAALRHARPVDGLLLDVDQPIVIDGLRHSRPIDSVGVQPLLGDQTGIGATSSSWVLDAGQALNNATSVDFDYHVIEGLFDSDQSVLGIDGARVTGPAGMRELTALTLGANVDGQERVQGEIAELRIYAGALSQADRDRILQELTVKWITG